jgi:hypothetical protein
MDASTELHELPDRQADARTAELARVLEDVRGGYGDQRPYWSGLE